MLSHKESGILPLFEFACSISHKLNILLPAQRSDLKSIRLLFLPLNLKRFTYFLLVYRTGIQVFPFLSSSGWLEAAQREEEDGIVQQHAH
jgi:hypothetical protein